MVGRNTLICHVEKCRGENTYVISATRKNIGKFDAAESVEKAVKYWYFEICETEASLPLFIKNLITNSSK